MTVVGDRRIAPDTKGFFPRSRSEHITFCISKKYHVHRQVNIYSSLAESVRFWCFRTLKNRRFFASRAICACLACASTDSRTLDYRVSEGDISLFCASKKPSVSSSNVAKDLGASRIISECRAGVYSRRYERRK